MIPTLSVLMSVRNGEAYLDQAIRSISQQTFSNFELLVMDDGSTDKTATLLKEWTARDSRVQVLSVTASQGLTAALQTLLSRCRTPFVARHDADDISLPDRFQKQLDFLTQHPEIALLGTAFQIIDEADRLLDCLQPPTKAVDLARLLRKRNVLAHGSWMARRSALNEVGGYREFFRYAQDYDLLLRLIEVHAVSCLPDPLYCLRLDARSLTVSRRQEQQWYAGMAQACARFRAKGQPDATCLTTPRPPSRPPTALDAEEGRCFNLLLKSLHAVKGGQTALARDLLSNIPLSYRPLKNLALRLLSFMPSVWLKAAFRQPRNTAFLN